MKKKFIYIISIVLLIGLLIYFLLRIEEKTFKHVDFEKNNSVINRTEVNYYDTIVHLGLNELNIENTFVRIQKYKNNSTLNMGGEEIDVKAYIIGEGKQYIIYLGKLSRKEAIKVLSHELIHLKQYYNKELVLVNSDVIIWYGDTLQLKDIPYDKRGWEIEAFDKQKQLTNKLNEILY